MTAHLSALFSAAGARLGERFAVGRDSGWRPDDGPDDDGLVTWVHDASGSEAEVEQGHVVALAHCRSVPFGGGDLIGSPPRHALDTLATAGAAVARPSTVPGGITVWEVPLVPGEVDLVVFSRRDRTTRIVVYAARADPAT